MPMSQAWYADVAAHLDEADKASLKTFYDATTARVVVIPPTAALLALGLVYSFIDLRARSLPRAGWKCTEDLINLYKYIHTKSLPTSW